jgi:putative membrane protein
VGGTACRTTARRQGRCNHLDTESIIMTIRYVPIAAVTALLTATPIVAQPQTTGEQSSTTGTTATQTDPSASSSASSSTTGTSSTTGGSDTAESDAATSSATATGTAAGAAAGTMTSGSNQLQGQDATFLRKAVEGDRLEIASAQAALDQAERTDTKNAARMILEDHRNSSQKLQSLASRKGWTLPSAASADADQAMTSASGSGSFDDRFLADQIRMHREAISLYRAQASGGADPDLRQFARDQLPHLEHHLEMLQGSNTQK